MFLLTNYTTPYNLSVEAKNESKVELCFCISKLFTSIEFQILIQKLFLLTNYNTPYNLSVEAKNESKAELVSKIIYGKTCFDSGAVFAAVDEFSL